MAKTVTFLDNRYELYVLPEARQKMELYCDLSENVTYNVAGKGFVIQNFSKLQVNSGSLFIIKSIASSFVKNFTCNQASSNLSFNINTCL